MHEFKYDYGQFYLYDKDFQFLSSRPEYMEAKNESQRRRLTVGQSRGLTLIMTKNQYNYHANLHIEILPKEPWGKEKDYDHVNEFHLFLPSSTLVIESAGTNLKSEIKLPLEDLEFISPLTRLPYDYGQLRARLLQNFDLDQYYLQLWPGEGPSEAKEIKRYFEFNRDQWWKIDPYN